MLDTALPLLSCNTPQIAAPGAIQRWGALLIADQSSLLVQYASANLAEFLRTPARTAIGQNLGAIIGDAPLEQFLARPEHGAANWRVIIYTPGDGLCTLALTAHCVDGNLYVELEPAEIADDGAARLAMPHIVQSLHDARDEAALFAIAMASLRRITGFDRVHVYRLHEDGHGEVIAENHMPGLQSLAACGSHQPTFRPRRAHSCYATACA